MSLRSPRRRTAPGQASGQLTWPSVLFFPESGEKAHLDCGRGGRTGVACIACLLAKAVKIQFSGENLLRCKLALRLLRAVLEGESIQGYLISLSNAAALR